MVLLLMVLMLLLRVATIFWRDARDAFATHSAGSRLLLLRMMVMVVRFLRGVYTPLTADPSLARLLCRYRRERLHGCNLCLRVPPHRLLRAPWPLAIKGLRNDLSLRGAVAAWSLRSKWLGLEAVNGRRRPLSHRHKHRRPHAATNKSTSPPSGRRNRIVLPHDGRRHIQEVKVRIFKDGVDGSNGDGGTTKATL